MRDVARPARGLLRRNRRCGPLKTDFHKPRSTFLQSVPKRIAQLASELPLYEGSEEVYRDQFTDEVHGGDGVAAGKKPPTRGIDVVPHSSYIGCDDGVPQAMASRTELFAVESITGKNRASASWYSLIRACSEMPVRHVTPVHPVKWLKSVCGTTASKRTFSFWAAQESATRCIREKSRM